MLSVDRPVIPEWAHFSQQFLIILWPKLMEGFRGGLFILGFLKKKSEEHKMPTDVMRIYHK